MNRRVARGNRVILAVTGLLLLAAGGYGLARGLGADARLLGSAHDQLTGGSVRRFADGHGWFWPVAATAVSLAALCELWWLAAQARTGALRVLLLERGSNTGGTRIPTRALASACEEDLTASPDLRRAHIVLTGKSSHPGLRLTVTLAADADPAIVRDQVTQSLDRLRQTMETTLPAAVRVNAVHR